MKYRKPNYIYELYDGANKFDEGTIDELSKRLYISPSCIRHCYITERLLFKKYRIERRNYD